MVPKYNKELVVFYLFTFSDIFSNCDGVILPRIGEDLKGKEQEFCPRCECKYENRNTTIIKVVVIIVIWVISLLVIYMAFLIILDPLLNKRVKGSYQEHTNEEVSCLKFVCNNYFILHSESFI